MAVGRCVCSVVKLGSHLFLFSGRNILPKLNEVAAGSIAYACDVIVES